jgi:hypothetical protein
MPEVSNYRAAMVKVNARFDRCTLELHIAAGAGSSPGSKLLAATPMEIRRLKLLERLVR